MKKIAIIFGGISFEHEISIVSAITLKQKLNIEIEYIFLDSKRDFYLIPNDIITSKLFQSGDYKKKSKLTLKNGGFYKKALFGESKIEFDMILNLIHGGDGEDGKLSSLFEFYGIKYIGPRVEASVVSSNKALTKAYAKELNIKVVEYQQLNINSKREVNIAYPFIIKPVHLGSSIGVSVVKDSSELDYALDVAFEFDNEVIIEPFIKDVKEYNLAGCKTFNGWQLSIIEEPQKEGMLDFEKKYLDFSRSSSVSSANIDDALTSKLHEEFKKIYNITFEGALIRCDFFIIDNEIYLNEINPIPGSMANYLFDNFEDTLIQLSNNLPTVKNIIIDYKYINSIQSAKGKS